jgi:hypothetical protein
LIKTLIDQVTNAEGTRRTIIHGRAGGDFPVRDLLLIVSPLAVVGYFMAYPDQLKAIMDWATRMLQ